MKKQVKIELTIFRIESWEFDKIFADGMLENTIVNRLTLETRFF